MNEQTDRTAAAVGYVCAHLAEISDHLAELGQMEALEQLLAVARGGGEIAGLLDRLHEILQADGDVLGVYGNAGRSVSVVGVPGPVPVEMIFLCPLQRCSRYGWPHPGAETPTCVIEGTPMVQERLR